MTASERLRIVLADDTPEYRELLRVLLELDGRFDIVGEAADGREAIEVTTAQQPDAIVLDLAMPVLDGLQAIPELRAAAPASAIVILSGFARGRLDGQALGAGAHAYVEKGEAFETIAATLVEVTAAAASA